jgi:hypothetical protein
MLANCTLQLLLSTQQQILAASDNYQQAEMLGNLVSVMNAYSDEVVDTAVPSKTTLMGFFTILVAQGLLEYLLVNMDSLETSIEDDYANVGPASYSSTLKSNTYMYRMRRQENSVWRFITSEELPQIRLSGFGKKCQSRPTERRLLMRVRQLT